MTATLLLSFLACSTAPPAPAEEAAHAAERAGKAEKAKAHEGTADAAPAHGKVAFVEPTDGAKVTGKFKVKFAVEGMKIHPAGELVPNTGHHHLIIDGGPIAAGTMVPMDDKHLHFGKGQTETEIELPPGEHRLTMQFADGAHVSYGEGMSASIRVVVE